MEHCAQTVAQQLDILNLAPEAASSIAKDAEYRLREVIQDACKFARHSKRSRLTTEDVNSALRMHNAEPMYGFSNSKDPAKYIRVAGQPDLFWPHDPLLPVEQLVDAPLPKPPIEVAVMPHWLFINGVQPATAENAPLERPAAARRPRAAAGARKAEVPEGAKPLATAPAAAALAAPEQQHLKQPQSVQVQPSLQHLLSRELQLYFIKVVDIIKLVMAEGPGATVEWAPGSGKGAGGRGPQGGGAPGRTTEAGRMLSEVLASLATDPGLHPLTTYFVKFIGDEVNASLRSTHRLLVLLRLADALLLNEDLGLEPYVHQLLPTLLTCLVSRVLGRPAPGDPIPPPPPGAPDHWAVRDRAASLVHRVCVRFGDPYYNVQPRVSKTMLKALLDPGMPLTTHYGAIVGLAALGHSTVRLLLLPQLHPYMRRLQPLLDPDIPEGLKQAPAAALQAARTEASRVYSALLDAVCGAMRERVVERADQIVAISRPRLPQLKAEVAGPPSAHAAAGQQAPACRAAAQAKGEAKEEVEEAEEEEEEGEGPQAKRARLEDQCIAETLAEVWREDCDLGHVMAALAELLGPDFTARTSAPRAAAQPHSRHEQLVQRQQRREQQ